MRVTVKHIIKLNITKRKHQIIDENSKFTCNSKNNMLPQL